MNSAKSRLLKRKTKKFFKVTLEVITGHTDEKLIRQNNINFLFSRTIYWMADVEKEYDSCFRIVNNHEQARLIAFQKLSI